MMLKYWKTVYILILYLHQIITVPVIDNKPLVFNLFEGTIKETEIGCITCTPTTGGNPYDLKIIGVSPTVPCTRCFAIWNTANVLAPPRYCLHYVPNVISKLSYFQASVYNVNLECVDDVGSDTTILEIRLNPNTPPFFTSLFESGVITNTKSFVPGDSIFLANAQDPDLAGPATGVEILTYFMTAIPDEGLFTIDEGNGQIRVNKDMREVCMVSPVELQVTVRDNADTVGGPKRISLTFSDVSIAPTINNIDLVIPVNELVTVPSTILTLVPSTTPVTYKIVAIPTTYTSHFTVTNGNDLTLVQPLNFEDVTFINLTMEVQDGFCLGNNWLGISIRNDNDPPVLTVTQNLFIEDEGRITVDPGFIALDEDFGQTPIFSFTVPNSLFSISPLTGIISSLGVLDLDSSNQDTVQHTLDVQVSDGFLATTMTIDITVRDINDNRPIILAPASYSYTRMDCDDLEKLGTVLAFDGDRGLNGAYEVSGGTSGPLTVNKDGTVYMSANPATGGYFVEVRAVDLGVPSLASNIPVTVSLVVLPCPQPSTTPSSLVTTVSSPIFTGETTAMLPLPNESFDFFTNTDNIPWLVLAGILALVLLVLILFVIHRLCCAKELPPFPKRSPSPPYQHTPRNNYRNNIELQENSAKRNQETNKRRTETDRHAKNNPSHFPQPPGPNGYRPDRLNQQPLNNQLPHQQPRHGYDDDARTMTPFKLENEPTYGTYKPNTDKNPYEFYREKSDGVISSRHINVSPKH